MGRASIFTGGLYDFGRRPVVARHISLAARIGINRATDLQPPVETAETNVTLDAVGNFIEPAFLSLHGPVRIGNELSAQGDHIGLSFPDNLFGQIWIVDRRHQHGDFHHALEVLGVLDHCFGMLGKEILPGLVGPRRNVQPVDSFIFHLFGNDGYFFGMKPVFHLLVTAGRIPRGKSGPTRFLAFMNRFRKKRIRFSRLPPYLSVR